MAQTVSHQIQLSCSGGTAKVDFPQGKDPRLKQQKLDLEGDVGTQYITLGGGTTRASGHAGYGEAILKDINETDNEIIIYLQMTSGNGYQSGLAGIVKVDRSRIRNDRDLEIVGDENEINYDQDYHGQILMGNGAEYRIPVVPVEGTQVKFDNIVPYNKTKPLGWNAKRFSSRMRALPSAEQFSDLKYLLQ
jgi:hypothetical protein